MTVRAFEPAAASDAEIAAVRAVQVAAYGFDLPGWPPPTTERVRAELGREYGPGEVRSGWLATADSGAGAGVALAELLSPPNDEAGFVELLVVPAHRRAGVGSALLAAVVEAVAAAGRTRLHTEIAEGTPGPAFAERHGFRFGQREPMSRLDLTGLDVGWLATLAAEEHPGYMLRRWRGSGPPDDLVDSWARVKSALADAPTGDTGYRTPEWDAERVRHGERQRAAAGLDTWEIAAVAADGTVAGLTEVEIDTYDPRRAGQDDTAVRRAHRGHGLGLWMKAAMLHWLRTERPDVTEIVTWNAESNRPMRAINETLGFAPDIWWRSYVLDLSP